MNSLYRFSIFVDVPVVPTTSRLPGQVPPKSGRLVNFSATETSALRAKGRGHSPKQWRPKVLAQPVAAMHRLQNAAQIQACRYFPPAIAHNRPLRSAPRKTSALTSQSKLAHDAPHQGELVHCSCRRRWLQGPCLQNRGDTQGARLKDPARGLAVMISSSKEAAAKRRDSRRPAGNGTGQDRGGDPVQRKRALR